MFSLYGLIFVTEYNSLGIVHVSSKHMDSPEINRLRHHMLPYATAVID